MKDISTRNEKCNRKQVYAYEWLTADEILKNIKTRMVFLGWSNDETSLYEVLSRFGDIETAEEDITKAHELWKKLKKQFNREAQSYAPDLYSSRLGSAGKKTRREVCRSNWWQTLNGDVYGSYHQITLIIEFLHNGEKLETGTIIFGS